MSSYPRHDERKHDARTKFADKLREWQDDRGLDDVEAAKELDMSSSKYYSYVNAITKPKNQEEVEKKMK